MNTRSRAMAWLKKNYPDATGKVHASKLYAKHESWTKTKVWWFEFPESDVFNDPEGVTNLLCEQYHGSDCFYLIQVPNQFIIESKGGLYSREKKGVKTFSVYISAEKDSMYIEQKGENEIEFKKFVYKKSTSSREAVDINILNKKIKQCKLCDGLNEEAKEGVESTLNAPGYGDIKSKVVIIGQSLCGDPCIDSQIPFTGGSGVLLDEAFKICGIAKDQVYITNVVKCHPPKNGKSLSVWKRNCSRYLESELNLLSPTAIICLGRDAADYFDKNAKLGSKKKQVVNDRVVDLYCLYHPQFIKQYRPNRMTLYIQEIANIIDTHFV